jgi:hypothetical protein
MHDVRLRRLDHDNLLLCRRLAAAGRRLSRDRFGSDDLLGRRLQLVVGLGLTAKPLDRGEDIRLLVRKRVTKLLQPREIAVHGCQYNRKRHQ